MKTLVACFATLTLGSQAFAHGSLPVQASNAIQASVAMFTTATTPEIRRNFFSISAEQTGHEMFAVKILLKDRVTTYNYNCKENEDVDPVIWECEKAE